MPVYLKQWKNGDFTLVDAHDREDAIRIFNQTGFVTKETILQLNAGDLTVTFSLRELCYPTLMSALAGFEPDAVATPRKPLVEKAVDEELKERKQSKLDAWLKNPARTNRSD